MEKTNNIRALVLSGGGSRGAFQVGALRWLAEEATSKNLPWYEAFCGVSVGAINSIFLAQYTTPKSVDGLYKLWYDLSDKKVKKRWFPFGRLQGLWKTGIYNTFPLYQVVEDNLDVQRLRSTGNLLRMGAVNLNTLEYKLFTEQDEHLADAVMGSCAFPIAFPAIEINKQSYVDGGVRTTTPLKAAIDIPEVTHIDLILATKLPGKQNKDSPKNIIDVGMATLEAMAAEIAINDLKIAQLYNTLVQYKTMGFAHKRYVEIRVIQPTSEDMPGNPLDFDHDSILKMMEIGYKTAIDIK